MISLLPAAAPRAFADQVAGAGAACGFDSLLGSVLGGPSGGVAADQSAAIPDRTGEAVNDGASDGDVAAGEDGADAVRDDETLAETPILLDQGSSAVLTAPALLLSIPLAWHRTPVDAPSGAAPVLPETDGFAGRAVNAAPHTGASSGGDDLPVLDLAPLAPVQADPARRSIPPEAPEMALGAGWIPVAETSWPEPAADTPPGGDLTALPDKAQQSVPAPLSLAGITIDAEIAVTHDDANPAEVDPAIRMTGQAGGEEAPAIGRRLPSGVVMVERAALIRAPLRGGSPDDPVMPVHRPRDATPLSGTEAANPRDAAPAGSPDIAQAARTDSEPQTVAPDPQPASHADGPTPDARGGLNGPQTFAAEMSKVAEPPPAPRSPLVQAVVDRIGTLPAAVGETVVRLNPKGLGIIEVVIHEGRDGALDIALRVQNPLVLDAMRQERDAVALAIAPQQGGAAAGSLSLDLFQSGAGQRDPQPDARGGGSHPAETGDEPDPATAEPRPDAGGTGQIVGADHVNIVT
jgi:hypothetical protein